MIGGGGSTTTGVPLGASVSPVPVSESFHVAAMSPATISSVVEVLLATQAEELVHPLLGVRPRVDERVVGADRAGQELEHADPAELVADGLEHVGQRLARRVGRDLGDRVAGGDRHRAADPWGRARSRR